MVALGAVGPMALTMSAFVGRLPCSCGLRAEMTLAKSQAPVEVAIMPGTIEVVGFASRVRRASVRRDRARGRLQRGLRCRRARSRAPQV